MALTMTEILNWVHLTNTVRLKKAGVPGVLPPSFYTTTQKVSGNKVAYVELYGTRKLANRVPTGAPGKVVSKVPLSEVNLKLVSYKNQMVFDEEMLHALRKFDKYEEQRMYCQDMLAEQGEQFAMRFENTRKTSLHIFLATGKNWFGSNGELLPSASGAVADLTLDQGVPVENTGQIDDPASIGGKIVNSSWQNPATDIVGQIRNLKTLAKKKSGYDLKYALYTRNVPGYLAQNESVRNYWAFDTSRGASKLVNEYEVPSGFMGLEWVPVQDAFYESESDVAVEVFPADQITFTPEVSKETYALYEGTTWVPGIFGRHSTGEQAVMAGEYHTGVGRFAYVEPQGQIIDVGFDCFLPKFRVPSSVFFMDTTP